MAGSSSPKNSKNNGIIHFLLFPLMAQGHMIPMLDIAKLLSQQSSKNGIIINITIFTTPQNASRFKICDPQINVVLLQLESTNSYENLDQLPSLNTSLSFFSSLARDLHPQALALSQTLSPKPTCVISDTCLPWTLHIANNLGVPWVSFSGGSCFGNVVMRKIKESSSSSSSSSSHFVVPGLEERIEMSKAQLPAAGLSGGMRKFVEEIGEAEMKAYGMIVNSFEELEGYYVRELKKAKKDKVWCVGPVSFCNQLNQDKALRGKASKEEDTNTNNDNHIDMMKWLDSQEPNSVVYICLGSLHNLKTPQLIELGLGLESSNTPFIWVVRASKKLEKWIEEEGFEERMSKARKGVIIRDWAPQLLILSHPSIGGFLTHCGWNSTLEGISAGLPMLTWPLFSDQFLNEKLVVNVLKIGVRVGAENPVMKMKEEGEEEEEEEEEEKGIVEVKKEDVREGIERLMGKLGLDEAEERRKKARELGVMAKNALEDGGSSQLNIRLLIDDILKLTNISI